jgi:DNA-binding GntR family transcriptional regulator
VTGIDERTAVIRPDYPEPVWLQTVAFINGEIADGALKPGMRLPPERQLCQQLGISRMTLRKALNQLVLDGVLNPSHGRGWYVARDRIAKDWSNRLESFSETAEWMGLPASSEVLRAEVTPARLDEAERLGVAPGAPLFHLDRIRLLSEVPIALDSTRISAEYAKDFLNEDFRTRSFYSAMASAGHEPLRADSTIEARAADAHVANHLQLEVGQPVLTIDQLVFGRSGRPLFTSRVQYSGERYRLRTVFSR